jgi:EF-hand domain pair
VTAHQSEETFLLRSFKFFDFKNSGEVDFTTFHKAIAKIGVMVDESDLQEFFKVYDTNSNNRIDYKEFCDIVFGKALPNKVAAAAVTQSIASTPRASRNPIMGDSPQAAMTYRGIRE